MEGEEKTEWICLSADILIGLGLTEKEIEAAYSWGGRAQDSNYALFVIILLHPI